MSDAVDAPTITQMPEEILALAKRFPMRRFKDAAGRDWEYRDSLHEGPVVVLLPGAAGGGDVAYKLIQDLCDEARTISITYPGGASPEALSAGLVELLDHLAVARVAIWGSSYGAWWSQAFAARNKERVTALWLGNTLVDGDDVAAIPLFSKNWLLSSSANLVRSEWMKATASKPPSELRDLQLYFIGQTLSAENLQGRLLQVANSTALPPALGIQRTVVCDCLDDSIIGPPTRKRVLGRYPGAQHVHFAEGGHYPHLVNFEELGPMVRNWLQLA